MSNAWLPENCTITEAGWLLLQGTEHGLAALTQQTLVSPGGTGGMANQ